jgi:hypothetical protein
MLNLSKRIDARVSAKVLSDIIYRRPAVRSAAFGVIEWQRLTPAVSERIVTFLTIGAVVDEWAYMEGADALVHCEVASKAHANEAISALVDHLAANGFFGVCAALWLISRYGEATRVYQILSRTRTVWESDAWLGRLVGGLTPIFCGTAEEGAFRNILKAAKNPGAEEVMHFHDRLRTDPKAVAGVKNIIMAVNPSKRLGITHAKFLMLLSILGNSSISAGGKRRYIHAHRLAWRDAFYRWRARGVVTPMHLRSLIKA